MRNEKTHSAEDMQQQDDEKYLIVLELLPENFKRPLDFIINTAFAYREPVADFLVGHLVKPFCHKNFVAKLRQFLLAIAKQLWKIV